MSQLLDIYLLETSQLGDLLDNARVEVVKKWFSKKYIDHLDIYLKNNATQLYGHLPDHYNANPLITLIAWLINEKNIDLSRGIYDQIAEQVCAQTESSNFIWTMEDKHKLLPAIENVTVPELTAIAKEYDEGEDENEMGQDLYNMLQELRKVFDHLQDEKHVLLVCAG